MLVSQTWHAKERKDTKLFKQEQQQEHIGGSNRTGEFHKNIVTKHIMCFTVESGPCPTETRMKTTSREIFGIPLQTYEKSKTKSRRKARIIFHQFQDVRSGLLRGVCKRGGGDYIYIRNSMERRGEGAAQRNLYNHPNLKGGENTELAQIHSNACRLTHLFSPGRFPVVA